MTGWEVHDRATLFEAAGDGEVGRPINKAFARMESQESSGSGKNR